MTKDFVLSSQKERDEIKQGFTFEHKFEKRYKKSKDA